MLRYSRPSKVLESTAPLEDGGSFNLLLAETSVDAAMKATAQINSGNITCLDNKRRYKDTASPPKVILFVLVRILQETIYPWDQARVNLLWHWLFVNSMERAKDPPIQ